MNPLKLRTVIVLCLTFAGYSSRSQSIAPLQGIHHQHSNKISNNNAADAGWYEQALKNISQLESAFYPQQKHGAFRATNMDNGISFSLNARGYSVCNITHPTQDAAWKMNFQILGLGRTAIQWKPGNNYSVVNTAGALTYRFAGMDVEYTNNKSGLRQNFIVNKKLPGNAPLRLSINLEGSLTPSLVTGNKIAFRSGENTSTAKLVYEDLKVWDARHQELDASFQLANNVLTIVVDDSKAVYPVTIDPLNKMPEWGTSVQGVTALLSELQLNTSLYGYTVTSVGDINGDTYGDVAISAPAVADIFAGNGTLAGVGAVFVFYGSPTGLSATPNKTLQPNTAVAGALFGLSVDAGDVTGDGVNDIVIGAPLDRINLTLGIIPINGTVGKVYIYPGGSNASPNPSNFLTLNLNTSYIGLLNISVNALFGFSVAVTEDLNNDNKKDIVVGSPAFASLIGLIKTGGAFVFLSNSSNNTFSVQSLEVPTFNLLGINIPLINSINGLLFGYSVDGTGDYNGDGKPDVVVGAPAGINLSSLTNIVNGQVLGGQAFVYYGKSNAQGVSNGITNTIGARLQAASGGLLGNAANLFGYKVKGVRGINGSRNGNILIGAPLGGLIPNLLGLTVQTGSVHVFKSKVSSPSGTVVADQQLESPRAASLLQVLNNLDLNVLFGASFDNAYDINCDGKPDLVVGEPLSSGANLLQLKTSAVGGSFYIFAGDGNGGYQPVPKYEASATYGDDILSVNATALFGFSVTGVRNIKGIGSTPRILVGSPSGSLDFNGLLNLGSTLQTLFNFSVGNSSPGKAYTYEPGLCSGQQSPLPVTLVAFTGTQKDKTIALTWKTEEEKNVNHYEVQRSGDGLQFETIGLVFSRDDSQSNVYFFTDKTPLKQFNYYRLNIVDKDGGHKYSNIISFRDGETIMGNMTIAPNPVTNKIRMVLKGMDNGNYRVELRNTVGQVQQTKTITIIQYQQEEYINRTAAMPNGLYWLTIYNASNQRVATSKIIMQ